MTAERLRVPAGTPEGGQYASEGGTRLRSMNGVVGHYDILEDLEFAGAYQEGHMQEINNNLRRGIALTDEQSEQAEALGEVIAKGELLHDRSVYRVVEGARLNDFYSGAEFVDKGFVSTSADTTSAEGIASDWGYTKPLLLEIRAKRGTKALDMNEFNKAAQVDSGMEDQNEIVFGRGHKFTVTGRSQRKSQFDDTMLTVLRVEMS